MHRNVKSIHKQPINCSQGKMLGKNHDFDTESFSKSIKFIRDIFLTGNFNCNAAEVTEVNFKTSACLFTFNSLKFMLTLDDHAFYVFLSKASMRREFSCSSIGSWHRGFCHRNHKF